MLQTKTATDATPRDLADLLDGLIAAHHQDREIGALLAATRDQLLTLAWNRYAAIATRTSAHGTFVHRHKCRRGRRAAALAMAQLLSAAPPARQGPLMAWLHGEGTGDA